MRDSKPMNANLFAKEDHVRHHCHKSPCCDGHLTGTDCLVLVEVLPKREEEHTEAPEDHACAHLEPDLASDGPSGLHCEDVEF